MTDDRSGKTDSASRSARLGAALRSNLRRRRAQEQARDADPAASALSYRQVPVKPAPEPESGAGTAVSSPATAGPEADA